MVFHINRLPEREITPSQKIADIKQDREMNSRSVIPVAGCSGCHLPILYTNHLKTESRATESHAEPLRKHYSNHSR
jgi:hypothetical protein